MAKIVRLEQGALRAAAMEVMEANIDDPLPLADLAAAAISISLRQLERMFQRYHGMGPAQYYLNVRLRRARELLTSTALPIMQITVACGFQSSSHFCKAYRVLFGMPPSEVRRREQPDFKQLPARHGGMTLAA